MAAASGHPQALVVGAGHNGLVAACYLAAAGVKVTVVERRPIVGGACVTEELFPGFRGCSCAFVAGPGLAPRIMRDLALSALGLQLYQTEVLACHIPDEVSRPYIVYRDPAKTLRLTRRLYGRGEARALIRFLVRLRMVAEVVGRHTFGSPPGLDQVRAELGRAGGESLFDEFLAGSVHDLLDRYFSSEDLKAFFTFLGLTSVWGGPSSAGTAYIYSHHAWGEFDGRFGEFGFARGGMGAISEALAARARTLGAVVETDVEVTGLRVEDRRVLGASLSDGREIEADLVLANTDPKRTFLRLVDRSALAPEFRDQVEALDFRGTMARVHLAVDRLPRFEGAAPGSDPAALGWTILGASRDRFEQAWLAQREGSLPEELPVELTIQSVHDPTLAPPGRHIITTGIQQLPYKPSGMTWDQLRPELEKRVISTLARYMPGLEESILGVRSITPLDLERDYGLTGGNLFHGAMTLPQLFAARPLPSCSDTRTPIEGLYICGSGTHPGGGVTGAPGYNAARSALVDLRRAFPYPVPQAPRPMARWRAIDRLMRRRVTQEASLLVASQRLGTPLVRALWR